MQQLATKVFIYASLAFGVLGIAVVMTAPDQGPRSSTFDIVLMKSFFTTVFIILPSFALSVAGKYLKAKP